MARARWILAVMAATGLILAGSARWALRAQDPRTPGRAPARGGPAPAPRVSVQDALIRPLDLPFDRETPLEDVAAYLRRSLGVRVVVDRSALDRQELDADATVRLKVEGLRLKTGLRLLLGQVGLTYRVEPEDNLLVITDDAGSDDPIDRVLAQLRSLHDDVHTLQESVDDLLDLAYGEDDGRGGAVLVGGARRPPRAAPRPRGHRAHPVR